MLEDVGLSLNLPKIFVQHCAILLAQQCFTMLASFEQTLTTRLFQLLTYKRQQFKNNSDTVIKLVIKR